MFKRFPSSSTVNLTGKKMLIRFFKVAKNDLVKASHPKPHCKTIRHLFQPHNHDTFSTEKITLIMCSHMIMHVQSLHSH